MKNKPINPLSPSTLHIRFVLCPIFEKIPSGNRFLTEIIQALKNEKVIEITYQSFYRQESNTFEVHPYCLKLFKQRWYMLARSENYNHPRIYALDRIHSLSITNKTLVLEKDFDAEKFFSNYFGIIIGSDYPVENIELKVSADQVKYFESLPLHHSQKVLKSTDEYTIFGYTLAPTFDFKQEILSRGNTVEVLAPEQFREEIKREVELLVNKYRHDINERFCSDRF